MNICNFIGAVCNSTIENGSSVTGHTKSAVVIVSNHYYYYLTLGAAY